MASKIVRWCLFLAVLAALALGCQASQEEASEDLVEIDAGDEGPDFEPDTVKKSEALGSGTDDDNQAGRDTGDVAENSDTIEVAPTTASPSSTDRTPVNSASSSSLSTNETPAKSSSSERASSSGTSSNGATTKTTKRSGTTASTAVKSTPKAGGSTGSGSTGGSSTGSSSTGGSSTGSSSTGGSSTGSSSTGGSSTSSGSAGTPTSQRTASSNPKTTSATTVKVTTTTRPTTSSSTTAATPPASPGELTIGYDASPPSQSWSKPAVGQTYSDPNYGTKLRRATSAAGTRFNRNDYSRRQAENVNGSLFMTYHGEARFDVYSVTSLQLVRSLGVHPGGEPQWHPTNPDLVRHLAGDNSYVGELKLYETNVRTGQTSEIADLTSRIQARLPNALYMEDRGEGAPSRDGNRYAWLLYDQNEKQVGLVSYDLASDRILGITTNLGAAKVDWSSYSINGDYVIAGTLDGTFAYNADLTNRRVVTTATEHSDLALDKSGNDAYVYIDFKTGSPTAGWLVSVDLRTLARTKIFDIYDNANTSVHISGRGFDKPGWVIVSTYNCKVPGAWTCEKVMAVEMAPNGRVVNLAHTYNCGDQYWTETHASVNRSFTRVYFNSDGGSCGADAEVYQLQVPSFN